jgi:hypothetical protein
MSERAVLFLAVSSEAQAADDRESLPEQRRALDEAAARFGWNIVDVIELPGQSRNFYTYREMADDAAASGKPDALRLFDHWKRRDFGVLAAVNTTRLGRDQSILAEVIRRTIDAGAQVYTVKDGWIDQQNQRMHIAMSGYSTGAEMDELLRRHKFGMQGRARRGLPTRLGLTHCYTFDGRGKPSGAVVNEANRRLFDDLYDLVVNERTPYNDLEYAMAARGHCDTDGRAFKPAKFYRLLHSPLLWGITHYGAGRAGQHAYGKWVYGGEPPPTGATINWHAVPPVYAGAQAERLIAELKRRPLMIGSARPRTTRAFTGVFVCAACGHTMSVLHPARGNSQIRCQGKYKKPPYCSARNAIFEDDARRFFDRFIAAFLERGGLPDDTPAPDHTAALARIAADMDGLIAEMDGLIVTQGRAHPAARDRYQARIDAIGTQLDALTARRDHLLREGEQTTQRARQLTALADLLQDAQGRLWSLPGPDLNQFVVQLLGNNRVFVAPDSGDWIIREP